MTTRTVYEVSEALAKRVARMLGPDHWDGLGLGRAYYDRAVKLLTDENVAAPTNAVVSLLERWHNMGKGYAYMASRVGAGAADYLSELRAALRGREQAKWHLRDTMQRNGIELHDAPEPD